MPKDKKTLPNDVSITVLPPEDWLRYRALRMHALGEETHAFLDTYEEAEARTQSEWEDELITAKEQIKHWLFFAERKGELVGVIGARRETPIRKQHMVKIYGVYVKKEARGQGIAELLMQKLLQAIERDQTVLKLFLAVITDHENAIALYEHHGFKKIGTLKKNLYCGDVLADEFMMEKILR